MDFENYIRKPFGVKAIEVTKENIHEIAAMVGKIHYNDEGVPYIEVDKNRVPNIAQVWPGYWLTKTGNGKVRCYTRKVFNNQFVASTDEIEDWIRFINGKPARTMPAPAEG